MLRPNDITDVSLMETTVADQYGKPIPGIIVSFLLRSNGPFKVPLPKEGFNATNAMEAVRRYATELTKALDGEV